MDPSRPIDLRLAFRDGSQRPASHLTGAPVWQGMELLGVIPAEIVIGALTSFIHNTFLLARASRALTDPAPGVPLSRAPLEALEQMRLPLAAYSPKKREELRAKRKAPKITAPRRPSRRVTPPR